jgi:plasmid stabilization system protein ParE
LERIIKPVYWTTRSVKDLEKITRFNGKLYGFEKAILISNEIEESTDVLESSSFKELGSVDKDFDYLSRNYRKIFYNHCKITYREGTTKIYVCRVFDTRQNPSKNK